MTSRLLIDEGVFACRALLLRDDEPDQFILENTDFPSLTGALFMGRVTSHLNDINAAFIDLGNGKSALLRAQDWAGDYDKEKPFSSQLTEGTLLPLQVTKDPVQDKAYQVSGFVTLEHPLLHLKPFSSNIQFPKSFQSDAEKTILKQKLKDFEGGFLIRSRANKAPTSEILEAAENLNFQWQQALQKIKTAKDVGPLYSPPSFSERMLKRFSHLATEIEVTPTDLVPILKKSNPDAAAKITSNPTQLSTLETYSLDEFLERRLPLVKDGHITIEPTEALIAIDVNAGAAPKDQANRNAALLIAQQLRLRNLSGMILIDFAGQQSRDESKILATLLQRECSSDPARVEVLGSSALGLMQMTRQRVSPPLHETLNQQVAAKGYKARLGKLLSFETALLSQLSNKAARIINVTAGPNMSALLSNHADPLCARYNIQLTITKDDKFGADEYSLED